MPMTVGIRMMRVLRKYSKKGMVVSASGIILQLPRIRYPLGREDEDLPQTHDRAAHQPGEREEHQHATQNTKGVDLSLEPPSAVPAEWTTQPAGI